MPNLSNYKARMDSLQRLHSNNFADTRQSEDTIPNDVSMPAESEDVCDSYEVTAANRNSTRERPRFAQEQLRAFSEEQQPQKASDYIDDREYKQQTNAEAKYSTPNRMSSILDFSDFGDIETKNATAKVSVSAQIHYLESQLELANLHGHAELVVSLKPDCTALISALKEHNIAVASLHCMAYTASDYTQTNTILILRRK